MSASEKELYVFMLQERGATVSYLGYHLDIANLFGKTSLLHCRVTKIPLEPDISTFKFEGCIVGSSTLSITDLDRTTKLRSKKTMLYLIYVIPFVICSYIPFRRIGSLVSSVDLVFSVSCQATHLPFRGHSPKLNILW